MAPFELKIGPNESYGRAASVGTPAGAKTAQIRAEIRVNLPPVARQAGASLCYLHVYVLVCVCCVHFEPEPRPETGPAPNQESWGVIPASTSSLGGSPQPKAGVCGVDPGCAGMGRHTGIGRPEAEKIGSSATVGSHFQAESPSPLSRKMR